jgi:predicted O-linked N-acetylglucosamine transferase (SPINDLY family)
MQILNDAPDSILWLLKSTSCAEENLKKHASYHGINPSRIIFAEVVSEAENIQRISYADLFLDTYPCNAHTTASDSMRAGVPLITISGETFASRVAGSILKVSGLDQLIAKNKEAYLKLAIQIYKDKEYLSRLKMIVRLNTNNGILYNIENFTRNFELALTNAHECTLNSESNNDIYL